MMGKAWVIAKTAVWIIGIVVFALNKDMVLGVILILMSLSDIESAIRGEGK